MHTDEDVVIFYEFNKSFDTIDKYFGKNIHLMNTNIAFIKSKYDI